MSGRPGGAEDPLDGGRALKIGDEVLQNVGVHGSGKRPKLFPVLDRLVAEMPGIPVPTQAASAQIVVALQLTTLFRREGCRNLDALSDVRDALSVDGLTRELSRVFDAIMWFAHPAASVWGVRRNIQVRLRD